MVGAAGRVVTRSHISMLLSMNETRRRRESGDLKDVQPESNIANRESH